MLLVPLVPLLPVALAVVVAVIVAVTIATAVVAVAESSSLDKIPIQRNTVCLGLTRTFPKPQPLPAAADSKPKLHATQHRM